MGFALQYGDTYLDVNFYQYDDKDRIIWHGIIVE